VPSIHTKAVVYRDGVPLGEGDSTEGRAAACGRVATSAHALGLT
jgi:hypothetical protein